MKLAISLSAENISKQGMKLPDTFAVVSIMDTKDGATEIGRTEVVTNTSSPDYINRIILDDYSEGEEMNLVVSLFNHVSDNKNESITSMPFEVSDVLNAVDMILTKKLKDGSNGSISMRFDKVDDDLKNQGVLKFQMRGINLVNTDGLGVFQKSDPFFELQCNRFQTKRHVNVGDSVYRSIVIKNNLSPVWPSGEVSVHALVGVSQVDDTDLYDVPFRIVVYDADDKRDKTFIGEVAKVSINDLINNVNETALSDIEKIDQDRSFPLLDDDRKEVGKILVLSAEVVS